MHYGKWTVIFRRKHEAYKLCKIWFGADGSYYATCPYHPERRAFLMKIRLNYALQEMTVPFEDAVDTASVEDDDHRLKLSHHPDGFVQFSGQGIVSGRDSSGNIKGMGVMSWPLDRPTRGPAFGLVMRGVEQFEPARPDSTSAVVFSEEDITSVPGWNTLNLEGHYFPGLWRRFVRIQQNGTPTISILHPCKAILTLRTLFASEHCARDGFIGLELYTSRESEEYGGSPFFSLTGSTGNVRRNLEGQVTADSVQCMYPRGDLQVKRILEYAMPEIDPA